MNANETYWKKRMQEILAHVDKTDVNFYLKLEKIYQHYYQETLKELFSFYQKYAKENNISMAEAKKRLHGEDLSDYRENAERYRKQLEKDPELSKRLNEQLNSAKATRLEALNLNLDYITTKMNKELKKSFEGYLKTVAKDVSKKINFGNSQPTISPHVLEEIVKRPWKGRDYSEQIWGNTNQLAKDLKKALTNGFIRGSSPSEIARELRKKYNVARGRAETLIRTDGTNVINNATIKRYQEAGLRNYQFLAHIDSRTTLICQEENKKVYQIKDYQPGLNAPPMHYNCRSTIIPDPDEIGAGDDKWIDDIQKDRQRYKADKKDEKIY